MGETEKKCFLNDLPDDTLVVGSYRMEQYDKTKDNYVLTPKGLGMHVEISDPDNTVFLSRVYLVEGKFSFNSHLPGEYSICLHSNSSSWFGQGKLRIHLNIHVGETATNYKEIAKKEKMNEIQMRVLQLVEQVEQISKEQSYQRLREEKFREKSESTNQMVLWWTIFQTGIFILTAIWQLQHLKGFFEAKKLV